MTTRCLLAAVLLTSLRPLHAADTAQPTPTPTPVFVQTFDALETGTTWLKGCKWVKHVRVTEDGVSGKCLRVVHDPDCNEPPLFPLPPREERPPYPAKPPCRVCSPYYTNTGTDVVQAVQPLTPGDEYSFSYDLYFEPGFDWAQGGKLPGLSAQQWDSGCSGEGDTGPIKAVKAPDSWSVRVMWRAGGASELYVYDQDRPAGACGSERPGTLPFTVGKWHALTVYVRLNSAADARDGAASLYVDGTLAREETDLRLRGEMTPAAQIRQIFFSTFFGGNESRRLHCRETGDTGPLCQTPDAMSEDTWVPKAVSPMRFDNLAVYAGLHVRKIAGGD